MKLSATTKLNDIDFFSDNLGHNQRAELIWSKRALEYYSNVLEYNSENKEFC